MELISRDTDRSMDVISKALQTAYDEHYLSDDGGWRMLCARQKARNIMEVCRGLARPARVLEVGAGEGSILELLDRSGFCDSLYALEISRSGLEQIGKRGLRSLKELQLFNGYDIPYPDDHFDLVILSHVLEHVEFPRYLLREIRRVSRHQVIEVPLDFSWGVDRKVAEFLAYGHIDIYLPVLFRFLLQSEGFELKRELVSINETDVFFHIAFVIQKRPRTGLAVLVAWLKVLLRRMAVRWLPRRLAELSGHAYTVFCTKGEAGT